jgi:hypothetical protein
MAPPHTKNDANRGKNDRETRYLEVRNWTKFQHYKDRRPPWVKLHVTFNEDTQHLKESARLVAGLLLCVAANKDNKIPNSPTWVAAELGIKPKTARDGLAALLADGFLQPLPDASSGASTDASSGASKTAGKNACTSRAPAPSREAEAETEEEQTRYPRTAPEPAPLANPGHAPKLNGAGAGAEEEHGDHINYDTVLKDI